MDRPAGGAVAEVTRLCHEVLDQVERAVVGKRAALELVLAGVLAGGHVLLEDCPGLGKTLAARSLRADPRAARSAGRSSPPTCCPPTSPARSSTTSAPASSSSARGRCSPGCCWPTRSTARRRRRRRRCSRRCRSGRSPSRARRSRSTGAVPRARDRQPGRVRGHLPAAGGPARPVPAAGLVRLPDAATRSGRARDRHRPRRARRSRLEPVTDAAGPARPCRRASRRSTSTRASGATASR